MRAPEHQLLRGKYYGLPLNTNCLSGVWSKTLLEQLGLEEIPSTYDEMLELKDSWRGQYLMSTEEVNTWSIAPLFYSLGAPTPTRTTPRPPASSTAPRPLRRCRCSQTFTRTASSRASTAATSR